MFALLALKIVHGMANIVNVMLNSINQTTNACRFFLLIVPLILTTMVLEFAFAFKTIQWSTITASPITFALLLVHSSMEFAHVIVDITKVINNALNVRLEHIGPIKQTNASMYAESILSLIPIWIHVHVFLDLVWVYQEAAKSAHSPISY